MSTKGLLALKSSCYSIHRNTVSECRETLPDQYIWRWELALQLSVDTHLTLEPRNSHSDLFIEEDRLNAVTGDIVWFEVAEELEEQFPLLRHRLAWLHPRQILFVVPAHMLSGVIELLCQLIE